MSNLNADTILEVVEELIGPIDPVADSAIDGKRFENLKKMTLVVNELVKCLHIVASKKDSQFASVKKSGKYAYEFLTEELGIEG